MSEASDFASSPDVDGLTLLVISSHHILEIYQCDIETTSCIYIAKHQYITCTLNEPRKKK